MSKPIVTATYEQRRVEDTILTGVLTGEIIHHQPGIDIELTFRLGDHERALTLLERAVADVRAQIEETR